MKRKDKAKEKWFRELGKGLSSLPRSDRQAALAYYEELYCDKRDAGADEWAVLLEFGPPQEAAARFLAEARPDGEAGETGKERAKRTGRHPLLAIVLFALLGFPALLVLLTLAAAAAALFLSGFVMIAAGIADFAYFVVQLCLYGASGGFVAHLGIGLAVVGLGCLFIPLFLFLTKKTFAACGKLFAGTGRLLRGRKTEADHA